VDHESVSGETFAETLGEAVERRERDRNSRSRSWADAYLLAFTSVAGLKFVTFDRALKSGGADVLVL
jgi:predicted nucleic acid-binding protein